MRSDTTNKRPTLLFHLGNWGLVILGGLYLFSFFTMIKAALSGAHGTFLLKQFPHVTNKWILYAFLYAFLLLGDLLTGILAAVLVAFLIVFILGFFFRGSPFRYGIATGLIAAICYSLMLLTLWWDFDSPHWGKHLGFRLIEIIVCITLIAFCGIAAVLGNKTRSMILPNWGK